MRFSVLVLFFLSFAASGFAQRSTVAELLGAPSKGRTAVLEGRIIGKANAKTYLFQDTSGRIGVAVDENKVTISREMKKGAPIRISGKMTKPFGTATWKFYADDIVRIGGQSLPALKRSGSGFATVPQTAPGALQPTARKPYRLPRLFGPRTKPSAP